MRLYEYEAKQVLAREGLSVPKRYGLIDVTANSENPACVFPAMIKAQVLTGGRGKAGGIKRVADASALEGAVREQRNLRLGTYRVETLLLEEAVSYNHELYMGITINPATGRVLIIASAAGGVDIEEVAAKNPELIMRQEVELADEELPDAPAAEVAAFLNRDLGLEVSFERQLAQIVTKPLRRF